GWNIVSKLFSTPSSLAFGPTRLLPGPPPEPYCIRAVRPRQLRALVRRDCPRRPGVYGMFDAHGELIYVGKAKRLRIRLLSYFRVRGRDRKAERILKCARAIAWEVVPSEFAALLRELELIHERQPRFNVRNHPGRRRHRYICLGRSPAPYVFTTRHPATS